jgi:branched-chain amino acid transport system ATP-binding protein
VAEALLEVRDVVAGYDELVVLRDISLDVAPGESVGLLGPNGHGKTTLLRHISGLHRIRAGAITFAGTPIEARSAPAIVDLGLVHVAQGNRLFPGCTVAECLELGAFTRRARRARAANRDRVLSLFPKLVERRHQLCGTLSGGERQMVAVAMGLMADPKLLILDEPTLGLAPSVRHDLLTQVRAIRESGLSLIVVDGDPAFLMGLTDRWYAIESGRVAAAGRSDEGLRDRELQEIYFGGAG